MCGRFSLTSDEQQLNLFFELSGGTAPYIPRYNGAPTQMLPVITNKETSKLQYFRWGLIPYWAKEINRIPLINAKSETIETKPSFKSIFKNKRCLVPADGFYEWVHNGRKLPYRFTLKNESLFAFAGVWDSWKDQNNECIYSFAILTTKANEVVSPVHDRMPVILEKEQFKEWLNQSDEQKLKEMLRPIPAEKMDKYRVSERVNSALAEGPELIIECEPDELFDGKLF